MRRHFYLVYNNRVGIVRFIGLGDYGDEKIQKDIMDHFQTEINLKKKIIEKEEIIENLKNELTDKEMEFFHSPHDFLKNLYKQLAKKKL